MKTLDEVIKAFEMCIQGPDESGPMCPGCPFADESGNPECCGDDKEDALHYLKAFRDAKDTLEREKDRYAEAVDNCEKAEAKYTKMVLDNNRNDPLTWEQLRQMEGKPVWVEGKTWEENYKFWCIVGKTDKLDTYIHLREHGYNNWKNTYGEWWQAYRKERK